MVGIAFIVAAVACFAALDTTTKSVASAIPVVMVIWFRYLFQAGVTAATLGPKHGRALLRSHWPMGQLIRALLLIGSSVFAFFSLQVMPIGEFTAIVMLTPLLITLLSALAERETISKARWLLVIGGFVGAMIVVRPSKEDFDWTALLPVGLVLTNTGFQLLTSRLAKVDSAGTMHFYTGLIGAGLATLALPFAWQDLQTWTLWTALLLMGVFSTIGHFLLIQAYRFATPGTLSPFLYLQIAFAAMAGWLAFGHLPDGPALAGIALITMCGATGTWLSAKEREQRAS